MDMKKAKINGNFVTVVSLDRYRQSPDSYVSSRTAIEFEDLGVVLPLIGKFDKDVGVSVGGLFSKLNMPSEEDAEEYSTDRIMDMSDAKNMRELIQKQSQIKDIEYEMLTSIDNKTVPKIGEDDTPAMKALKTAVIEKEIDINKYGERFGSNFNNDKRQLNKNSISIQMLERLCRGLDIKASLMLEDTSDDVANPIGRQIVVDLTEGDDNSDV